MAKKPVKVGGVKTGRKAVPSDIPPWTVHLLALIVIMFFGLFCYAETFAVPFVLDDVTSILQNPLVKSFDFRLKTRILGDLSFAMNYKLNGFEPAGYHLVNLSLHLLNAGLVYLLVQLVFRTPLLAGSKQGPTGKTPDVAQLIGFGAALLFVCHPMQTQAVTYIAQRVAVMAATFYLGALICYAASRLSGSRVVSNSLLGFSLLLTVAGVLTKEHAITIPLVILLFELTFFRGPLSSRLFPISWYLLPLLVAPLLLLWRIGFSADLLGEVSRLTAESGAPSRMTYLLTQFPVIVDYLRLFLLPIGQSLDHDVRLHTTLADPGVLGSMLLLVMIAACGCYLWMRAKRSESGETGWLALAGFGIGWFFIALAVESSVIPIRDVMFEHRLYLPSVGLVLLLSAAVWQAAARWREGARSLLLFLSIILFLGTIFGATTFIRNRVWQNEITLWKDVVSKSPAKARGYGSLGHAQQRAGQLEAALENYRTAIRLAPGDHVARNNLGTIYLGQNRSDEALEQFKGALSSKPSLAVTHYNVGLAYAKLERFNEAVAAYREAIRLGGENDQVLNNLGIALFRQGQVREALASFREAVRRNPSNAEAAGNLASLEKALK